MIIEGRRCMCGPHMLQPTHEPCVVLFSGAEAVFAEEFFGDAGVLFVRAR